VLQLTLIFNFMHLYWVGVCRALVVGMIVCHCRRVNDRMIRAAIRDGAETEEAVADACGAGSCCGGCVPAVTELLDEECGKRRRLRVLTTAA
jgi:bacterioferritin-associated ferredoxin